MGVRSNRFAWLAAGLCVCLAVAACELVEERATHAAEPDAPDVAPTAGSVPFDTRGQVPGDPTNGVADLKAIFKMISVYRSEHDGQYPPDMPALQLGRYPQKYGYAGPKEAYAVFQNPDNVLAYGANPRRAAVSLIYTLTNRRIDGSLFGSPKPAGTRDVLTYTDIYYHPNVWHSFFGEQDAINPAGYYLVLWDDGQVEKICYDQMIFVWTGVNTYAPAFSGETGLPAEFFTYDEQQRQLAGLKERVRGKPVAGTRILPVPDNGAPEALLALSRLTGQPLDRERMWQVLPINLQHFSLDNIQSGAQKLGVGLKLASTGIEEVAQRGVPVLMHLRNPDAMVALAGVYDDRSIIYDEYGTPRIVATDALRRRYTGEALTAASPATAQSAIEVADGVQRLQVEKQMPTAKAEITFKNRGTGSLELQVELPACGCAKATLSSSRLSPGESAKLDLELQWRRLPGQSQTDFITVRTNDPVQPRIAVGVELDQI